VIPRLVQWQPIVAYDEIFLLPTGDLDAILAKHPIATRVPTRIGVDVTGVNIDGGRIDVGDGGEVIRIANGTFDEIVAAAHELAPFVEPSRFVVRDELAMIELAGVATISRGDDWAARIGADDLDAICNALDEADPETLPIAQQLADAFPDAYRPRAILGSIWFTRGKLDDARRELSRAALAEAPDHVRAMSWSLLGRVLLELGESADAIVWLARATASRHREPDKIRLGVAYAHDGKPAEAWDQLRPYHAGRALIEVAEALAKMSRHGDARAFLRAALECEPKILDPVPENQWPKTADVTWATRPDQLVLIAAAKRGRDG
jgi:tetratricopeptide (TPR) repeat protein